ncbi:stalk domain-containing protein [Paenibacillus radicis (ex Xue et al. 2023)]|uniref:Phosphodiester glycosidase family protein n=1 Tax=Paenibacillus radicis (ex Xue et al. 2023) TaxID=2972489 RepID=A0ABT1YLV5_9BACL|nr:phosphodiester glycosidase family protein [Paenibacillus radicis (ex Xue et al. 2023)]MCR8634002.1 phosphodiester glycosidase family protein [Paenibacillus radicis (ex Xue et al. 2023)]
MIYWKKSVITAASAAVLLAISWTGSSAQASESVVFDSTTVQANGKKFTVQWTTIDLSDPYIRVMPITAEAGIGYVESFAGMIERSDAVAGVNGTFFDAYEQDESKRHPNGLMIESGSFVRSGENVALGIQTDKTAQIHQMQTKLSFKVKHNKNVYTVNPWGVNTYYGDDADQVIAYTSDFAQQIDRAGGMKAVIEAGRITSLTEGAAAAPENGYVIYIGHSPNNDKNLLPNLHEGDQVEIEAYVADGSGSNAVPVAEAWETAIGAGPKLVTNGQADVDFERDGFDDPKITGSANTRSFVGVNGEGRLVMGTVSSATAVDMAQALVELGMVEAMNMDGGSSSALYAEGMMKRSPGRLLSNALIVKRYDDPQVQVVVNGKFVNENRGFIKQDVTMVPFRGIFERIGADFKWDGEERVLTAKRGTTELTLRPDVPDAIVNGRAIKLEQAPVIVDGHLYIPLRFAGETLGAKVSWDQLLYRATLELK